MKKFIIILLVMISISIFFIPNAYAIYEEPSEEQPSEIDENQPEDESEEEEDKGWFDFNPKEYFLELIHELLKGVMEDWNKMAISLVEKTMFNPFSIDAYEDIHKTTSYISMIIVMCLIAYGFAKNAIGPTAGIEVTDYRDLIPRAIIAIVWILFSYKLVQFMLDLNNTIVRFFLDESFKIEAQNVFVFANPLNLGFLVLVLIAILIVLIFVLIFQYYKRMFEIVFIAAIMPFAAAFFTLEESAKIWGLLLAEAFVAVFMQSGQVICFFIALKFFNVGTGAGAFDVDSILLMMAGIIYMISIPAVLRRLVFAGFAGGGGSSGYFIANILSRIVTRGRR